MAQIYRYFNNGRLIVYERLYASAIDKSSFVNNFDTQAPKLPIFRQIHAEGEKVASEKLNTSSESLSESFDAAESTAGSISDCELTLSQIYL